jgi:type I restriction enzyme S subunit
MEQLIIPDGYKKTKAGIIPEDWGVDLLDNVLSITTGGRNTQDKIKDGKYPFYVRSQTIERINSYSFDGEGILTAGDGVGTGKVFHYINGKCDIHQRVYLMHNFSKRLHGYYFYIYFKNNFYDKVMSMTAKSSVDSVRREMIAGMPIALPSIKEQIEISNALSDVDALITSIEKLIAKKQVIKTATMQQLLTGKKRLPPFDIYQEGTGKGQPKGTQQTEIGEIPEDWEVANFGEIGQSIIGLTYSPNDVSDFGTLVLRSSNVQKNKLAFENNVFVNMDLPNRVIVKEGDILVCVRNGSRNLIGKCALIDKKTAGSAFGAFMSIYRTEHSKFVFYQFQSDIIQNQINEMMGATINQITNKDMASFIVPYPKGEAERTAIGEILTDIDSEIDGLEKRLSKTLQIKQGMMQELLTGKTRLI